MLLPEQTLEQSSKPEARLEANVVMKPTQGFHKEQSFRNRIWRHIKFLHLGFELFYLVFKKKIVDHGYRRKNYGRFTKLRVFEFMQNATVTCTEALSFATLLRNIALLFTRHGKFKNNDYDDTLFNPVLRVGRERDLPTLLLQNHHFSDEFVVNEISGLLSYFVLKNGQESSTSSKTLKPETYLKFIRVNVFHLWLSQPCNRPMKRRVHQFVCGGGNTRPEPLLLPTPNRSTKTTPAVPAHSVGAPSQRTCDGDNVNLPPPVDLPTPSTQNHKCIDVSVVVVNPNATVADKTSHRSSRRTLFQSETQEQPVSGKDAERKQTFSPRTTDRTSIYDFAYRTYDSSKVDYASSDDLADFTSSFFVSTKSKLIQLDTF